MTKEFGYTFGYARVSTKDQNLDRQLVKFEQLGIPEKNIFMDKESGKDFDRKFYQLLRDKVREGDIIYFDSLDRLGRDYDGIIAEWKYLSREVGVDLVVLENTMFDTRNFKKMNLEGNNLGRYVEDQILSTLSYVADMERKKNLKRQAEGIAEAHKRGVKFGRKKVEIDNTFGPVYERWKAGELTAVEAYTELGWKHNTFYRRVKEWEQGGVNVQ